MINTEYCNWENPERKYCKPRYRLSFSKQVMLIQLIRFYSEWLKEKNPLKHWMVCLSGLNVCAIFKNKMIAFFYLADRFKDTVSMFPVPEKRSAQISM